LHVFGGVPEILPVPEILGQILFHAETPGKDHKVDFLAFLAAFASLREILSFMSLAIVYNTVCFKPRFRGKNKRIQPPEIKID